MKPYQTILFCLLILAVIWLAIDKCNKEPKEPISPTEVERGKNIQKADSLGVVTKTLIEYRDRIRTKEIHDTTYITTLDSAQLKMAYDSLGLTVKKCVVQSIQLKSRTEQLAKMDSVHTLDTVRISLLTLANLQCDTLRFNDKKEADKDKRKAYFKGLKHGAIGGFVAGYITGKLTP